MLVNSANGRWIATIGREMDRELAKVWEAKPPYRELFAWQSDREICGIAFSADSQYLIVGGSEAILRTLNWRTNGAVGELGVQNSAVVGISASLDGRFLASTGQDGEVVLWDATRLTLRQEGQVMMNRGAGLFFWVEFSPDGSRLAVGENQGDITILDTESGKAAVHIPRAHGDDVIRVPFSPDGKYIASCSADQTVRIWEADTGRPVEVLIGHDGPIYSVKWSPDGKHVASAGSDRTVRIWTPRLE